MIVADDSMLVREGVVRMLESAGFEVVGQFPRLDGFALDFVDIEETIALAGIAVTVAEELVVNVVVGLVRPLEARERRIDRLDVAGDGDGQGWLVLRGDGGSY